MQDKVVVIDLGKLNLHPTIDPAFAAYEKMLRMPDSRQTTFKWFFTDWLLEFLQKQERGKPIFRQLTSTPPPEGLLILHPEKSDYTRKNWPWEELRLGNEYFLHSPRRGIGARGIAHCPKQLYRETRASNQATTLPGLPRLLVLADTDIIDPEVQDIFHILGRSIANGIKYHRLHENSRIIAVTDQSRGREHLSWTDAKKVMANHWDCLHIIAHGTEAGDITIGKHLLNSDELYNTISLETPPSLIVLHSCNVGPDFGYHLLRQSAKRSMKQGRIEVVMGFRRPIEQAAIPNLMEAIYGTPEGEPQNYEADSFIRNLPLRAAEVVAHARDRLLLTGDQHRQAAAGCLQLWTAEPFARLFIPPEELLGQQIISYWSDPLRGGTFKGLLNPSERRSFSSHYAVPRLMPAPTSDHSFLTIPDHPESIPGNFLVHRWIARDDDYKRVVLVAGAGMGKTLYLRYACHAIAAQQSPEKTNPVLPFSLSLQVALRARTKNELAQIIFAALIAETPFFDSFEQACQAFANQNTNNPTRILVDIYNDCLTSRNVVLFLDDWQAVTGTDIPYWMAEILPRHWTVVVSTDHPTPDLYETIARSDNDVLQLNFLPLSAADRRRLSKDRKHTQSQNDPVFSIPLVYELAVSIRKDSGQTGSNRAVLYGQWFQRLIQHPHQQQIMERWVWHHCIEHGEDDFSDDDLKVLLAESAVKKTEGYPGFMTNVFVWCETSQTYRLPHESMLDYLAARHMYRLNDFAQQLEILFANNHRWGVVIFFCELISHNSGRGRTKTEAQDKLQHLLTILQDWRDPLHPELLFRKGYLAALANRHLWPVLSSAEKSELQSVTDRACSMTTHRSSLDMSHSMDCGAHLRLEVDPAAAREALNTGQLMLLQSARGKTVAETLLHWIREQTVDGPIGPALELLVSINDEEGERLAIETLLDSRRKANRLAAAKALGKTTSLSRGARKALEKALRHDGIDVCMAAIQALEPQLHSNLEALHSSNVEEQLRSIFERLCGHDNNQIRCASILAITRIDPSPTTTVILNQQLTNPSSLIRYAACLSLAKISTPDALSILSKTTKGTDERLTLFAAAALATQNEITEAEETETQTILLEALQKKFFPRLVMGALENAGNSKRNVWLLKTLAAQKKATPLWLLAALRRSAHLDLTVKQRQQTVRLLDHFHNHTDPLVRLGVMQVYEALSENSAIPRLLDHCRSDCSTAVRKSAVQALAEIGTPEADKALARLVIKSLEQADSEPCGRYLFRVLGDRNLSEASQALWNVLDSTHLQYQLAAAQALANQISRAPHRKHAIAKQRLVDFLKNIENKLADSTAEKVDISRLRVMWMSAWQILSLNKPVNRNAPLRRPK